MRTDAVRAPSASRRCAALVRGRPAAARRGDRPGAPLRRRRRSSPTPACPATSFPTSTLPTLQLLIQSPGRAGAEIELAVAQPVEQALLGLPGRAARHVDAAARRRADRRRVRQRRRPVALAAARGREARGVAGDFPAGTEAPLAHQRRRAAAGDPGAGARGPGDRPDAAARPRGEVLVPRLQSVPGVARVELARRRGAQGPDLARRPSGCASPAPRWSRCSRRSRGASATPAPVCSRCATSSGWSASPRSPRPASSCAACRCTPRTAWCRSATSPRSATRRDSASASRASAASRRSRCASSSSRPPRPSPPRGACARCCPSSSARFPTG